MPMRSLSIDPSRPLRDQMIGFSVHMPVGWLQEFQAVAKENNVSCAQLVRSVLKKFADEEGIELPPYR